jgi:hypothetical protein
MIPFEIYLEIIPRTTSEDFKPLTECYIVTHEPTVSKSYVPGIPYEGSGKEF